jgi:hypothetical protein
MLLQRNVFGGCDLVSTGVYHTIQIHHSRWRLIGPPDESRYKKMGGVAGDMSGAEIIDAILEMEAEGSTTLASSECNAGHTHTANTYGSEIRHKGIHMV